MCPPRNRSGGGQATSVEPALFDDLVCLENDRLRNRQTEGLGGLQVDDQRELRRLLDGQLTRLCPIQNLRNIPSSAPMDIERTRTVGDESTAQAVGPTEHR